MQFKTLAILSLASVAVGAQEQKRQATNSADLISIYQVLQTALPSSLVEEFLTNSAEAYSQVSAEFAAGSTPAWYSSLPTNIQTYLVPAVTNSASAGSVISSAASAGSSSASGVANSTALNRNTTGIAASQSAISSQISAANSSIQASATRTPTNGVAGGGSSTGSSGSSGTGSSGSSSTGSSSGTSSTSSSSAMAALPTAAIGMGLAGVVGLVGIFAL